MTDNRTRDDLLTEIRDLENRNENLSGQLTAAENQISDLQNEIEDWSNPVDSVHQFLDLIERPVGTLRFIIPQDDRVNGAILGLYDAVGRNL